MSKMMPAKKKSLRHDIRGAELIEKLVTIALFVLIAAAGMKVLGTNAKGRLDEQAKTIGGLNTAIGEGGTTTGDTTDDD